MSSSTSIINDSEGESDDALHGEPRIQLESKPAAPAAPFHYEIHGYQTVPASGELRKKAIDEAHAALLSTAPASPTQIHPGNPKEKAKRRQTAHGRLEDSGQDIYAFDGLDDGGSFHPGSESKKRKRPSSEKKAARTQKHDESDGYEEDSKSSRKKLAKRTKSASTGLSVLDLLNDSSEDGWRPNASKPLTSGKKSTRNNTIDTDLLPPLPKPKRKPRESAKATPYFDGNLTLGFNRTEDPSTSNTHNAEIQVAATEPGLASTFMIDLTHDEHILPHERRAEYNALSPELSAAGSPQHLPATSHSGVYDTPDLRSTIPDPPYDLNFLPSQSVGHSTEIYTHMPEAHSLAHPSIASDSPLSSLENSPVAKPAKKPKVKKRAATDQHLELALSEEDGHAFDSFPVASEWRAAKGKARQGMAQTTYAGRAKTSNAVDLLPAAGGGISDDDVWTGDGKTAQKKRKPAAKKQRSTTNDDEGTGEVTQKTKPKRKRSKPVETLLIGDSEDELSGGKKHGLFDSVQVAATASTENPSSVSMEKQVVIGLNVNQKHQIPGGEPYDPIADGNPMLPAADTDRLVSEESRPPGLGAGTKKAHKWGRPKFLDKAVDEGGPALTLDTTSDSIVVTTAPVVSLTIVELVPESLPEPTKTTKKETAAAAKRRKSKKDNEDEEDWAGDTEPARKPTAKKEAKAKTPRVTKRAAAAAAAAKEAKEQKDKEEQLSSETIKSSDDDGDLALATVVSKLEPKPVPTKKAPGKKGPKPKASKAAAKKDTKAITTSKETVSDAEDEEEDKKQENTTPAPEPKLEAPQTPQKILAERVKKTPHSPISKGPVKFRVGLSRRAHIEPLLKIIRK